MSGKHDPENIVEINRGSTEVHEALKNGMILLDEEWGRRHRAEVRNMVIQFPARTSKE